MESTSPSYFHALSSMMPTPAKLGEQFKINHIYKSMGISKPGVKECRSSKPRTFNQFNYGLNKQVFSNFQTRFVQVKQMKKKTIPADKRLIISFKN